MTPRTHTRELTDHSYWRRLLATVHPDRDAGDAELFVFLTALKEHVEGCAAVDLSRRRDNFATGGRTDRVPFDPDLGAEPEFWTLTARALSVGHSVEEPYRSILHLLLDCGATDHGRRADRQMRGASYKQLAAIGHKVGMSKSERVRFYEICRAIPLSDQHAHHLLQKLQATQGKAAA